MRRWQWDRLRFFWGVHCTSCRSAGRHLEMYTWHLGGRGEVQDQKLPAQKLIVAAMSQYDSWWSGNMWVLGPAWVMGTTTCRICDDNSVTPWPEKCANTKVKNFVDLSFISWYQKKEWKKNLVKCYTKETKSEKMQQWKQTGGFPGGQWSELWAANTRGTGSTPLKSHALFGMGRKKKSGERSEVMRMGLKEGTLKK